MIKNALKFDESPYPFEDILKFHKWDFENKLTSMIEVYISNQLQDSDKRIEASIEDQRRQSAELPDDYELDLEEYFKDF